MESNHHAQAIPSDVTKLVLTNLEAINDALAPYATPLTAQERKDLPTMGEKTLSFVEKAFEFAEANPTLCPPYLDREAFRIDMGDATGLRVIRNDSRQVFEALDDIILLAGSEAYQCSLAFYGYIKLLASQDVPRTKAIYEELKKRFPGRKKSSKNGDVDNGAV